MKNLHKIIGLFSLLVILSITGCKKEEYSFGAMKTPSGLALTTTVVGVDNANPTGNGTGAVAINVTATNAITYNIDFGDGNTALVPSGKITYKYTTPGVKKYTITVNAIGTGGIISTISKAVTVYVAFEIPTALLTNLTGASSKVWIIDKAAPGHFGVGPGPNQGANETFFPSWYAAGPDSRAADGFYDDEITFSKDANNNVSMDVDNKGNTFVLGAAVAYYGLTGGEGQFPITTLGVKRLSFMNATSNSTAAISTRIQFSVPGNGLVAIGIGSNMYEIISITSTTMTLRTIGVDGNAWYQMFKVK
ncbi:MAG: PKD domain-containing protein [Chitinophagia bacterium]|jgi:hypothetical protein